MSKQADANGSSTIKDATVHAHFYDSIEVMSAAFDPISESIVIIHLDIDRQTSGQQKVGKWSFKDGALSESHEEIPFPENQVPQTVAFVQVEGKAHLVFGTVEKHGEGKISQQLWEANFPTVAKGLLKEIDTSNFESSDYYSNDLTAWKNLMLVTVPETSVYAWQNLEYHSKLDVPLENKHQIKLISVSDKYFVIESATAVGENTIRAYSWSPEKLSITKGAVFGPISGRISYGNHLLWNTKFILINIGTWDENLKRHMIVIHNIEDKSSRQYRLSHRKSCPLQLIVENKGKSLLFCENKEVYVFNP